MDTAYLTAIAALAGSAIGGLTSFFSSWLTMNTQIKVQLQLNDKLRREELYRDFIDQASQLYIDALTNDKPNLSKAITIYALVSRMRVISSPDVIDEADKVARMIVESYPQPNRTFDELREMVNEHTFDPLQGFSHACRAELGDSYPA